MSVRIDFKTKKLFGFLYEIWIRCVAMVLLYLKTVNTTVMLVKFSLVTEASKQ